MASSDTSPTINSNPRKENLDDVYTFSYEKSKQTFNLLQQDYIKKRSAAIVQGAVQLWSREKVDAYIDILREFQSQSTLSKCHINSIPKEVATYDILISDVGTYKLVLKTKLYRDEPVQVIPFEDCFDVILQAHRRLGHRGSSKALCKYVLKQYVVDKIWILLLLRACNVCRLVSTLKISPTTGPESYYKIYQLFTHTMEKPDEPFKHIMIVVDKTTGFVHLRPLSNHEPQTFALELINIFTDFGPPKVLITKSVSFFEGVCEHISSITNLPKTPLLKMMQSDSASWIKIATMHLLEWMTVTGCSNWAIGCQIVQWQMNNTLSSKNTPYKEIFHMDPVKEILG